MPLSLSYMYKGTRLNSPYTHVMVQTQLEIPVCTKNMSTCMLTLYFSFSDSRWVW